jgi:hypothetical protein
MAALSDAGFVQYDDASAVVLIPKALKHQAPSTENQIKGAITQLERIPRTSLWDAFRMACASHCPKLSDAINERWPSDELSHADGSSRVRAGARAPASSSSSSSSSKPPRPPSGGRTRDRVSWGEEATAWARSVGVDGSNEVLLRAVGQAKPWERNGDAAEFFRSFAGRYFDTTLAVEAPTEEEAA